MTVLTIAVQADGADEPTILRIKPRQVLAWEKSNSRRSAMQLNDDAVKFEYLYEIAWLVMGKPGEFDQFCATTDVTFAPASATAAQKDESPDPTNVAATTES